VLRKITKQLIYLVLCLCTHFYYVTAQNPFIQNFSPKAYNGAGQNWGAVQEKSGMIYVANNDGVLQYDGLDWRLIALPNNSFVHSLALAPDGKIFVGGNNELGYLSRDLSGKMAFTSLSEKLKGKVKQIKTIRRILVLGNKVFFQNHQKTFIYEKGDFTVLDAGYIHTFSIEGQLYVRQKNKFLLYQSGKLLASNILDEFDTNTTLKVVPYQQGQLLIGDKNNQLWIYHLRAPKGAKLKAFATKFSQQELKGKNIWELCTLPNQQVGIITYANLYILGNQGQVKHQLNTKAGLVNGRINQVLIDHQGNGWLMTGHGISLVMLNTPITQMTKKDGFRGVVYSLGQKQGYTYLGGSRGAYYRTLQQPKFRKVSGVDGSCWNFYNYDGDLYLANATGVYLIKDSTAQRLARVQFVHSLTKLNRPTQQFIVGTYNIGIWLIKKEGKKWTKTKIKGFDKETRFVQEDDQGNIWVSHYNEGVYKLKLNASADSVVSQQFYNDKNGLPSNKNNRLYRFKNGKLVYATTQGFYEYNRSQDNFVPIDKLNQALGGKYCIYTFHEDAAGNIYCWMGQGKPHNQETLGVLKKQANGTYKLVIDIFNNIALATNGLRVDVDAPILVTPNKEVLVGNLESLLAYNAAKNIDIDQAYQVIIHQIQAKDSTIYRQGSQQKSPVLPYAFNNLKIRYAAMTYENPEKTRYSYRLKGFNDEWSPWEKQARTSFTNLPEGKYTFEVKAINIYKKESQITSFSFQILPPWFRTWWAYTLYVLLGIVFIGLVAWLNSRRLLRQKIVLEKTVQERTEEVQAQNEELLQNQDEILAQRNHIEDQNKYLTQQHGLIQQSIKSAETIQKAILPFASRVQQFLPNYFVLYRPKDVVSGDFYWIEQVQDKIIIIGADCTGHGVPGAFMSLIGFNLFDKIIFQQGCHDPAQILTHLQLQVAKALRQPESNNINGMDAAIVVLEKLPDGNTHINYAGARRPLYYASANNELKIEQIKGSRKSIGGHQNKEVLFENHTLSLPSNSVIYLGSDGLADQNNKQRKKFGAKKLESLLQEIVSLSLEEQKTRIEKALDDHMLGTSQRDDILWMGIRLV
jgi:serine phosphatase RsbU (regulator of sigma subunit)/ligand-binding sensor domain-containing protein